MEIARPFECVAALLPEQLETFRKHIDPEWIEEALQSSGTATVRRRRLPAEQVVWLVLGMGLMRNRAIEEVVDSLNLAMPDPRGVVAKSAISQARKRLGEEPLAYLFERTSSLWADQSAARNAWRGLALFGIDGTTLRVADSEENRAAFGAQNAGPGRGQGGYPMVRIVALMALRSHLLRALRVSGFRTGEVTLARELWGELPDDSLTIVDRNFLIAEHLTNLTTSGTNRHWLTRAKSTTRLKCIRQLGKHDQVVEIELSAQTRRAHPDLPKIWQARAITYQRKGFPQSVLLTSLLDSKKFPASELIALYHERWEIEIGYDELKTHMLARQETIRSKTPEGVRQELWGIAIAYNLIRLEMERAAAEADVPPNRISFVYSLNVITQEWLAASGPRAAIGNLPRNLRDIRQNIKRIVLPTRRTERIFPRAVKVKMSSYPRKRPTTQAVK